MFLQPVFITVFQDGPLTIAGINGTAMVDRRHWGKITIEPNHIVRQSAVFVTFCYNLDEFSSTLGKCNIFLQLNYKHFTIDVAVNRHVFPVRYRTPPARATIYPMI
jgi:hypothetical protein